MDVSILPQKKYESAAGMDQLKVRVTMILEARTKEEKKELREKWGQLEDNNSVSDLLKFVGEMNESD